jgi:hypothetical protein
VQDRGVQVADMVAVDGGLVAQFVGLAIAGAATDTAADQPVGDPLGLWSRPPLPPCETACRPNSPLHTIRVESSRPPRPQGFTSS